ncbi:hypothetical protein HAX54_003156 [Datura stramonium]|uniref:Uncharacterized protein n=1 Tax=Datura stramonium TaxID=4076 RepID=A0ABS8T654_DATST|nr:hypothetical protein [Datura stramonium]
MDQSDGLLYLTTDRCIGSWVVTEDPTFRSPFRDRSNRTLFTTTTRTMTSLVNKKQQEAVARKEIAKRRQLRYEFESKSSSGSEFHYNIETYYKSPVVTTRAKSKAQEAAAATTSPPQSNEGNDEAESDGDNPPANKAEKGNDDAEESGDDDTNAKESGDKDSSAEESNEQVGDSEPATTLEARSKR